MAAILGEHLPRSEHLGAERENPPGNLTCSFCWVSVLFREAAFSALSTPTKTLGGVSTQESKHGEGTSFSYYAKTATCNLLFARQHSIAHKRERAQSTVLSCGRPVLDISHKHLVKDRECWYQSAVHCANVFASLRPHLTATGGS